MRVKISKSPAIGAVRAPASKSMSHRLLIAAALARGESRIAHISACDDVLATAQCLKALGVGIEGLDDSFLVSGVDVRSAVPQGVLSCRESGSTMRFMIPIALMCGRPLRFSAEGRLLSRPLDVYEDIFRERGIEFSRGDGYIELCGRLSGGEFRVRGDISSQFISGLLLAAPLMEEDSRIVITSRLESRSYIDLTLDAMAQFGVSAVWESENTLFIKGNQNYRACDTEVEGDYSGAAFVESFNLFGGDVKLLGLRDGSLQGDRAYREHFEALRCGAPVIDLADCPDLAPILFAVSAALFGAEFTSTTRLKIKESDRAAVMAEELAKFGAKIDVFDNSVTVHKCALHAPTEPLCGHGDHRIVMSLAVLASLYGAEILGAEAVNKSYPEFFDDIKSLGIDVTVYED